MFPRKSIAAALAIAPLMFAAQATTAHAGGGYGWGAFAAGTLAGIAVGAAIAGPPVYAYPAPVIVPGPPVVAYPYPPAPWVRYGPPVVYGPPPAAVYGPPGRIVYVPQPVFAAPPPRVIYGPPPPVVYGGYRGW
jgi:hypothetical protein